MGFIFQALAGKLGIVTGKNLAQHCRYDPEIKEDRKSGIPKPNARWRDATFDRKACALGNRLDQEFLASLPHQRATAADSALFPVDHGGTGNHHCRHPRGNEGAASSASQHLPPPSQIIGTAIGINILSQGAIPLWGGCLITGFDTFT
jgi:hypothetical protein